MTFHVDTFQHIGRRREQQDSLRVLENPPGFEPGSVLIVVADGMGGMSGGAEAGRRAVDAFCDAFRRAEQNASGHEVLLRALSEAGHAVFRQARAMGLEGSMGTTLVAAMLEGDRMFWVSVGDSRLYLYRAGHMRQLNTEHNLEQRLMRVAETGQISYEDVLSHPERHSLTSFLGLERVEEIDGNTEPIRLRTGDRVLVCSDGLHGTVSDDEIGAMLTRIPAGEVADALGASVLERARPQQDNISLAVATVGTLRPTAFRGMTDSPSAAAPHRPRLRQGALLVLAALLGAGAMFTGTRLTGCGTPGTGPVTSADSTIVSPEAAGEAGDETTEEQVEAPRNEEAPEDTDENQPAPSTSTAEEQ